MISFYKTLLFVFFIGAFEACTSNESPTLSEDEYVDLVVDLQIAESAVKNLTGTVKDSIYDIYMDQVATRHTLEKQAIERHMELLETDMEMFLRVYERAENYFKEVQ